MTILPAFSVILRNELRSAARHPSRCRRILTAVAIPVAIASTLSLLFARWSDLGTAEPEILGGSFEQFVVIAGFTFVLIEIGLVSSACGFVGFELRQREIALLLANGASRGGLIAAQTVVSGLLGLIGAVVGVFGGISLCAGLAAWSGTPLGSGLGAFVAAIVASLPLLLLIVGLGVGCAVIACSLPAWLMTRIPPREILVRNSMGVVGTRSGSAWLWALSASVSGCGAIVASLRDVRGGVVIALAATFVLSCGFAIPFVLERCARGAHRLPLAWRMAVRDAARMRRRVTPPIAAGMASLAVGIAIATLVRSITAHAARFEAAQFTESEALHLMLVLCMVAAIATNEIATALCASESNADAAVLKSLGAEPGLVRGYFAAFAGHHALLTLGLGIPAGVVAAVGVLAIADTPVALRLPWSEITIVTLSVPALAYGLRANSRFPIRPLGKRSLSNEGVA